ncbi:substrate-binding domain-containing protein [Nonomuraea sp. SMC257]|uniref:Substrate-binding domain-containing protein n=1 Tax=Nonomuraea montanisoli TaxID=2741721 RepID=A0A7Y6I537_9ACTN|nr:substrate-binding domain-containing protein [Nonomuraea montanisoli]NUW30910.1 substrate-binding domain-containing protein [Nonomuraea montanisoli]
MIKGDYPFGVPHDPALLIPSGFDRADGYEQTRRLLSAGASFTAVFAATDMVAIGVLAALREAGISVPDDVSVAGYDDIPFAADITPGLTTVRIPTEELGRTAVRLALHPEERQHVVLGTHIVVRDSVRPPRQGAPSRG